MKLISRLPISMALITGLLGFAPSIPGYCDSPRQTVVVTRSDLKAGVVLVAGQLEEKEVEKRLAPLNAVAGVAECVGRVLKKARPKGQIILIDDLGNP